MERESESKRESEREGDRSTPHYSQLSIARPMAVPHIHDRLMQPSEAHA